MPRQAHFDAAAVLQRTEKQEVVALCQAGRLEEAENRAEDLTRRFPAEPFGWSLLGTLRLGRGEAALAVSSLKRAARLAPEVADIHNNLGVALADAGCPDDALACYHRALALNPASVAALTNQGATLEAAGRLEEAAESYRRALALNPGHAKAHYNLGNTQKELGHLEEALDSYDRALALAPDYAFALTNRGIVLADLGRLAEASACARAALGLAPDLPQALDLSAACLLATAADPAAAMDLIARSLAQGQGLEAKRLFVACLRRLPPWQVAGAVRDTLGQALAGPWDRPELLAGPAARALEHDPVVGDCLRRAVAAWPRRLPAAELFAPAGPDGLGAHPLLPRLLIVAPVCTVEMERFLTLARTTLLEAAETSREADPPAPDALAFYAALARQCHINEYAFDLPEAEGERAQSLGRALLAALASDGPVPVLWPVAVAAYFPLSDLPVAERLLARPWPGAVAALLTQQVRENAAERAYQADMAGLTPIEDEVSLRVRRQYEENPYPRWVMAAPVDAPGTFDAFVRRRFPRAAFTPLGHSQRLDVLVAGCGTGQHTLETARRFRGADVLAVDLSLASLGYAKRKANEAGAGNIAFAQADILRLGSLSRRFDVIESTGVLHHLADPFAGWRILLTLLRPGGCMRLGFYSDVARRGIVRARVFLQAKGYTATAASMRRCRQELLDLPPNDSIRNVLLNDFYSLSGCRDLLFHVCEKATTLLELKAFLLENDLHLLGFDIDATILSAYKRRFPEDPAATDLSNWHYFEKQHPETFLEMYQFWVQKGHAASA